MTQHERISALAEELIGLWREPPGPGDDAEA